MADNFLQSIVSVSLIANLVKSKVSVSLIPKTDKLLNSLSSTVLILAMYCPFFRLKLTPKLFAVRSFIVYPTQSSFKSVHECRDFPLDLANKHFSICIFKTL